MHVGDLTFIKELFSYCKGVGVKGGERGPSVILVRYTFCARKETGRILRFIGCFLSLQLLLVQGA